MTGTLYIARHGNTFAPGESARRIGARTDLPLVPSGRAQAAALGRHFAANGISFARIHAGPLARTQETASIIAAALPHAATVETAPWLIEVDHGPDEGMTEPEVAARIGADALIRWDSDAVPPPGWIISPDERITDWRIAFDLQRHAAGPTLFVTSNGAARFARIAAGPPGPLKMRTGAYGTIVNDGARWRVEAWDVRP